MVKMKKILLGVFVLLAFLLLPHVAYAMHITEGILPLKWVIFWFIVIIPFVVIGTLNLKRKKKGDPRLFTVSRFELGLLYLSFHVFQYRL